MYEQRIANDILSIVRRRKIGFIIIFVSGIGGRDHLRLLSIIDIPTLNGYSDKGAADSSYQTEKHSRARRLTFYN